MGRIKMNKAWHKYFKILSNNDHAYITTALLLVPIPIMVITVLSCLPEDGIPRLLWALSNYSLFAGIVVVLLLIPPLIRYFNRIQTLMLVIPLLAMSMIIITIGYNIIDSNLVIIINGIILTLNSFIIIKSEMEAIAIYKNEML
jgi:hypothetical protein